VDEVMARGQQALHHRGLRNNFHLQLIFDMACFTEEQVEDFVYGVERVAIEAAFNPEAPAGCG
jgi:hypothetical protein